MELLRIATFVFLVHAVLAHIGAPDDDSNEPRLDVMRFATSSLSPHSRFIKIYLHSTPEDKGTLIKPHNLEIIRNHLEFSTATYVLFNGHPTTDSLAPFQFLRAKLLEQEGANVLVVFLDWSKHKVPFVDGIQLAEPLAAKIFPQLMSYNVNPTTFHFIAHCLGAEIAVMVAKKFMELGDQPIRRLSVFDPYVHNNTKIQEATFYTEFVDVYHAGIYSPPYAPLGTIDFYPNAGIEQPGCNLHDRLRSFICSHQRSIYLYMESINTVINAIEAKFDPQYQDLQVVKSPNLVRFGHMVDKTAVGAYYLPCFNKPPYLMNYF